MALEFNANPYLQLFMAQQQREREEAPDINRDVTQPILQGLQMMAQNKQQQQLLDLQKEQSDRERRQFEYEYGTPQSASESMTPGTRPLNMFQPGMPLVDQFKKWKSGGMKSMIPDPSVPAATENIGAKRRAELREQQKFGVDLMKENRAGELSAADLALKRAQTNKYLSEAGGVGPREKAPSGYRWGVDGSLEAIPGGPAEAKIQSAQEKKDFALKGMKDQADIVIGKVDQALSKVGWNTAGIGGAILGKIPGTEATDLNSDLDTIKAILGFNTLAEMRKSSPTGGALGAISDRELRLLTAARASLDQEQSDDQLKARLQEIRTHYQNWLSTVEGVNPDENGMEPSAPSSGIQVGEIRKGYRFTGGNPADKNSWEKMR